MRLGECDASLSGTLSGTLSETGHRLLDGLAPLVALAEAQTKKLPLVPSTGPQCHTQCAAVDHDTLEAPELKATASNSTAAGTAADAVGRAEVGGVREAAGPAAKSGRGPPKQWLAAWTEALRGAALKALTQQAGGSAGGAALRIPTGLRHCLLCGETLATPRRMTQHLGGKKHCAEVAKRHFVATCASPQKGVSGGCTAALPVADGATALGVLADITNTHLGASVPEPPDFALVLLVDALTKHKHQTKASLE